MDHIVIIRPYQPNDEIDCKKLLGDAVKSSMTAVYRRMMLNEITFQLIILLGAISFIFFGVPLTICTLVIPAVFVLIYIGTYMSIVVKATEINQEDISRVYMSNTFSFFWVAELFEPYLMSQDPKNVHYTVLTDYEFRHLNIPVSLQAKKIVGTIGLCKSHTSNGGAWIKRLCIDGLYKEKGIAECLLMVATEFATNIGYSHVDAGIPAYQEMYRELFLKKGFEIKQMYHKRIIGSLITMLMYEFTYRTWRCQHPLPTMMYLATKRNLW